MCPVAVPGIFVGIEMPSSSADRCHSLSSLHLPPAALASLPGIVPAFHVGRLFCCPFVSAFKTSASYA